MQDRMTKWPVLLVHGLFYREDYWGRVPGVLRREGAVVLCPRHQSTARVAQSGGQLARLIREAAGEGGKVNLIAHSKGGLDSRWAISREGAAPYVASLTTVNTPHRGCLFVDKLLEKLPRPLQRSIAAGYDAALEPVEGLAPDFFGAVEDLTATACAGFNREVPDAPGVFYQSAGSRLERAAGGRSPMGLSQLFIQGLDGPNDGLVAESSFLWGETYTLLTSEDGRGVSHEDVTDLWKREIPGVDVPGFYRGLVLGLGERGL